MHTFEQKLFILLPGPTKTSRAPKKLTKLCAFNSENIRRSSRYLRATSIKKKVTLSNCIAKYIWKPSNKPPNVSFPFSKPSKRKPVKEGRTETECLALYFNYDQDHYINKNHNESFWIVVRREGMLLLVDLARTWSFQFH